MQTARSGEEERPRQPVRPCETRSSHPVPIPIRPFFMAVVALPSSYSSLAPSIDQRRNSSTCLDSPTFHEKFTWIVDVDENVRQHGRRGCSTRRIHAKATVLCSIRDQKWKIPITAVCATSYFSLRVPRAVALLLPLQCARPYQLITGVMQHLQYQRKRLLQRLQSVIDVQLLLALALLALQRLFLSF